MPVYIAKQALVDGISSLPYYEYLFTVLKVAPWLVLLYLLKLYFGGATNTSERLMHSKVVMITGGTSGIGAEIARGLATRGAQIVLLTQHSVTDPFLVDYIDDLRTSTNNELINAEKVDLSSLHSIRVFATKWVDNAPPRRLDMLILCGNTLTPRGRKISVTQDGIESNWGINYLANFHMLSILSPALRAQPPDRDVRIIFGTCSSYMGGELSDLQSSSSKANSTHAANNGKKSKKSQSATETTTFSTSAAYATSQLALMTFASAFQKHLSAYLRPDKQPMNARVILADPGFTRTPGMRRYLTWGSISGLFLYLLMYPFWWLVLKSPEQGAQSFLMAAMDQELGRAVGGKRIKECREVRIMRKEVEDEEVQKGLWELSERTIEKAEREGAVRRALEKKEREESEKAEKSGATKISGTGSAAGGNGGVKKPDSRRTRKAA
ncbi:hypothetical protein BJ546DRAFT_1026388 [Cryomyces antarcticus]